jgi:hypothetical protein
MFINFWLGFGPLAQRIYACTFGALASRHNPIERDTIARSMRVAHQYVGYDAA